jgi:hypothetical protein
VDTWDRYLDALEGELCLWYGGEADFVAALVEKLEHFFS